MIKNLRLGLVTVFLLLLSLSGFSQACPGTQITISIQNITQPSPTTLEFDVYVKNTGTTAVRLAGYGGCVRYPATMQGAGTLSLSVVNQPSASAFPGMQNITESLGPNQQIRWTHAPFLSPAANAINMPVGLDMKFVRFRLTNSIPWPSDYSAQLFLSTGPPPAGVSSQTLTTYCNANTTSFGCTLANGSLVLLTPPPIILNPTICATSGVASNITPNDCFGDTVGSATITMSPTPSSNAITYVVDTGAPIAATLTSGAFIVGNLTTGNHTIIVTGSGICTTPISVPLTIGGPTAPFTNTTTISACDSYTWPVTGLTYTTTNTYTGTSSDANGCTVFETLNLTVGTTTTGTTTATACDTYTWALPLGTGLAYTTNQTGLTNVTTNASGCPHTQTLNLTVGTTTSGTTTTTACDSYVWALPLGTGLTYTTNQTGLTNVTTNASGCPHTQTLNLTVGTTTSGTTTTTACDTYTWALPLGTGLAYTTNQTGLTNVTTNASGCPHTQTLNLTINNSTTGTTTATACDSYVWALPLGTGLTYTTNQTGLTNVTTNAAGCPHTQTLNLTVGTTTSGTTTATSCDTYTWALPLGTGLAYTTNQTGLTNVTTNASGCPHTQTLNLTINNSSSGTTTTNACGSYTWALPLGNGLTYTTNQTGLTNTTTNAAGCPHVQTLNLTVTNNTTSTITTSACTSYVWPLPLGTGLTYTTNQTGLTNTTTNAGGCTHTETLNLTINNPTSGTTTATACDTYTWAAPLGNGLTYTTNQTGITFVSTNAAGCAHTQTLNLTINNSTTGTTTATACDTYTWALPLGTGLAYTTNQTGLTNVTTNAAGCPHTQTLNLTINSSTAATTTATACSSYTWALPLGTGLTYTTNQTGLINTTTNAAGCPHVQTLNLTINNPSSGTTTTTACDTYTWAGPLGNGLTYTTNQTGLTFVSTNAAGCPHTQTLNLTINNSTSGTTTTTACDSYTWALPLGTGLTYTNTQTVTSVTTNAAGCPHTQTLNLTINNSTAATTNVAACTTYTWALPLGNGTTYTTSQFGVTNVTTNAAGCPHTQTLNLTINNPTSGTTTATACNTYTWAGPLGNGVTYTSSQTGITYVSTNANGCPHTQTLNLTINNSTTGTTTTSACNTYIWSLPLGNGQTYTSSVSGITHNSINANGCPHVQTLNLTINSSTTGTTTVTACDGYTWAAPLGNGLTYTSSVSGVTKVSTNAAGCQHTQTLNLTINHSSNAISNVTACGSYTWAAPLGNGLTYTTNQSGLTNVTTNAAGCPHTQMLNLTINNSSSGTTTTTACNSYTWAAPFGNGQTYTSSVSGVTHVSTNAAGCPHTQTLNLTINNSTSGTTTATACDSYTWALPLGNGQTYTSSVFGVTKITTNANGCPHTQTLNLTINNSSSGTDTATACNSYTWAGPLGNGLTYTSSQAGVTNITTNVNGCPHTQTLNLTINNSTSHVSNVTACTSYTWAAPLGNGQTYTTSVSGVTNVSTNAGGCPHTETLNLTVNQNTTNGSVTTTAVNTYTWAANNVTYTSSGTYTHVTTTSGGCTNTATLNLTIIVVTGTTWYQDLDGDGYGNPANTLIAVVAPVGYVAIGTDCNDNDPTINPGAIEVCYDGIDNDCNGVIDNVSQPGGCIAIVTSLVQSNCGATLLTLRDKLTAHYVVGAQGYRFRIKNLTDNTVIIRDRPLNWILLSTLPGITYNTTYRIDIALLINNVWQPVYGAACNVTTPTPVSTIGAHCGTILQSMNQWVYATYHSGVNGYRFRVTNTTDSSVQILDQTLNRFNFNQLPNRAISTVYYVEVALKNTDGTYMPYSVGCNVTTPATLRLETEAIGDDFKVIAYPNPYAENFKLNVKTSSESALQIRVYDMLGKQIENKEVQLSELENLQIGTTYPSGVYNLIVTQQGMTQTVRVIKR